MPAFDLPDVIPTRKVVRLGGQEFGRETFAIEIGQQSLADVRAMIRGIVRQVTAQQALLNNPPSLLEIDGKTDKDLESVQTKAVVVYGVSLATTAMRLVEMELAAAIDRATTPHSGRLRSILSTWQWVFVPKGRSARIVTAGAGVVTFNAGDVLCLMPWQVPYATLVNRNVKASGRLAPKPRKGRAVPVKQQHQGFLSVAARAVRRHAQFKQFVIGVDFTRAHEVSGELMTRTSGTGYIKIRARYRQVRV